MWTAFLIVGIGLAIGALAFAAMLYVTMLALKHGGSE